MKRYNNLYKKVCEIENLKLAHKNARKDKTYYHDVKMVDSNPDYYLNNIRKMLLTESYQVGKYKIRKINDKGKIRELHKLPYYPDRIIQWAILLVIERIFMEVFTNFTCASIKNRGTGLAINIMKEYLKDTEGTKYCLKLDVSKFYPNINHDILKSLLCKKIKDNKMLNLLYKIIDSMEGNIGIPIGSYLSQFLGNFYLAYFDHWVKEYLKIKYAVRYMDDIILMDNSKEFLHKCLNEIDNYLKNNLELKIKDNWQVFQVDSRGVDFVGYRFFHEYTLLRKRICKNIKYRYKIINKKTSNGIPINQNDYCSMNSYYGFIINCDGYRFLKKYYIPLFPLLNNYYLDNLCTK